jgi:hypothetical protein
VEFVRYRNWTIIWENIKVGCRSLKGDPLPDEHHVLRHCSGRAIEKDDEGQPIGLTKDAFDDDDPDGVSVTWIEYFAGASDCERTAIAAICGTLTVRRTHRFGKFNVGMIRAVGTDAGVVLGVEHDPIPGNEGHALIKGLVPSEHFALMNRLALELVALLSPNL